MRYLSRRVSDKWGVLEAGAAMMVREAGVVKRIVVAGSRRGDASIVKS